MGDERYVMVFRAPGEDAPLSVRTWSLVEAQQRAAILNQADPLTYGRWTVHELSDEIHP